MGIFPWNFYNFRFVHVDQEGLKKKMTDQAAKDRREIAILEKTKSYLESSIADQEVCAYRAKI